MFHRAFSTAIGRGFIASVVALALLAVMKPAAARQIIPIAGGSGDAGFHDRCPANQYLIGFAGRAGEFVDQIQIICSPVQSNGTHGPSYYGPAHGGTGGAALEFSCNDDAFVSEIQFSYYEKHPTVFDVELSCRSMQGHDQSQLGFGIQQGVSFSDTNINADQRCPGDELASGLAGRYGKNVNALGLFCDDVVTGHAPAPADARDSWPIRTTGKAAPTSDRSSWPIRVTGKAPTPTLPAAGLACPQGFVWREASPEDHVCVAPVQRTFTRLENAAGPRHVSQTDRTYGPHTCIQGYVWREAYPGDAVCVTPLQRDAAAQQNATAPAQIEATTP